MRNNHSHHRWTQQTRFAQQRGMAAIAVSLIMLLAASIAVLYLNRSLIFEQRTSANFTRATTAQEIAEAGIEWATGMLNVAQDIDSTCTPLSTAVQSFRKKYILTNWGTGSTTYTWVASAATTFPGCQINSDGSLNCSCPTPTASVTPADLTATLPGFTVAFANIAGDSESVKVTSTGCTTLTGPCTSSTSANADARATVSVILKMRRFLRAAPSAALTCGAGCNVGGNFTIVNTDLATNGVLVDAGSAITSGTSVNYYTLPGVPVENALVSNDSSLSALYNSDTTCSNSKLFSAYFGSTISEYAARPQVKNITCTSASDCGTQVTSAYDNGWRSFYFTAPDGFAWNNSSGGNFGSPTDPVTMVSGAGFDITGNLSVYGMVFSNTADFHDVGFGTANVYGAVVTCGEYNNNATGLLQYDGSVLGGSNDDSSTMVRVPGSWKDY
jgi:Tfp pilus assembly protein PilX